MAYFLYYPPEDNTSPLDSVPGSSKLLWAEQLKRSHFYKILFYLFKRCLILILSVFCSTYGQ